MQDEKTAAIPMNDREREVAKHAKKDVVWMVIGFVALAVISKIVFW